MHNGQVNQVHRYIIAPNRTLIGHPSSRTLRYMHGNIPYMVNNSTDSLKCLYFNGMTDKFGHSFCKKIENPVVSPSDWGKIHETLHFYFFMRIWRSSSSTTFIIDAFSFDQYSRSHREKRVLKTLNLEFKCFRN